MKKNIPVFLSFTAMGIYTVLYGCMFMAVTFGNIMFDYRLWLQVALLVALGLCLTVFLIVYNRIYPLIIKHRYKILVGACVALFGIQMLINSCMVPTVIYDHDHTLQSAIAYATGDSALLAEHLDYLHKYPFQAGIVLMQGTLFKFVSLFGCTDWFGAACVLGDLLLILMVVTTFIYLDENFSGHRAVFYLVLSAIYIPFYFQGSVSYTDTYSIWGIPCLLLSVTRALKADSNGKRIGYALLAGVLGGLAMQIKNTVLIVLVALIIQRIVNQPGKKRFYALAVVLAALIVTNSAYKAATYSTLLDENRKDEALPLTHWVMMGLQGDGSYSYIDEMYITVPTPPQERVAVNMQHINQRLSEMGPAGYLKLLYMKTCRTFGCGNRDLRGGYCFEGYPQPVNLMYDIVLLNGRYYGINNNLSQAVYLLVLGLGAAGGALMLKKKDDGVYKFAPFTALTGFWMFMMIWESNHRQLINQWSLLFICGAVGLYQIWKTVFKVKE